MALYRIADKTPRVAASAFVAVEATVIGAVTIGERSSVWPGAVARGDNETIAIGAETSIQDGAVLHADPGFALTIGDGVTVGHQAMLHGCTIGDGSLIGIKALILNHAVVGRECLIGANALVTEGKSIPDRSLVLGSPGKVVRTLTDEEVAGLRAIAAHYVENARRYLKELVPDPRSQGAAAPESGSPARRI